MAAPIQSSFGDILLACQSQVVANVSTLTINPGLVLLVSRQLQDVPRMQADQDVLLRPGSFQSLQPAFDGAGRVCTKIKRFLTMYPRSRLAMDEGDRDDAWLTDSTYGHLAFEEACVTALSGFIPRDTSLNWLTIEELRISDGIDPKRTTEGEWGDSGIDFDVEYLASLHGAPWVPPLITTTSLASGTEGTSYSASVAKVSGYGTVTWSKQGTLPTGLTQSSSTGTISGTPTVAGTYTFVVVATDANSQKAAKQFSIVIAEAP